ncbi:uncharacterized protein [Typha latifolia]|uniref:uncharacterized protein isoform X2 n=1 Tax=Typha latifolia TaxID=4733 RepID=UPI003C2B9E44
MFLDRPAFFFDPGFSFLFSSGFGRDLGFRALSGRSMDPSLTQSAPEVQEDDEWDTDGFVIPSLSVRGSDYSNWNVSGVADLKPPPEKIFIQDLGVAKISYVYGGS